MSAALKLPAAGRTSSRRHARHDRRSHPARRGLQHRRLVCDRCGSVFSHNAWREGRHLSDAMLTRAAWTTCAGCRQVGASECYARILLRGGEVAANLDAIRRLVAVVARREIFGPPARRVIGQRWDGATLEILTNSQQLAHHIVHEITAAFGGKASYSWSNADASLFATWECERHAGRER